jgi:hypothetical protein
MSINAQPFNPTFKLIGNLEADQVLTYDVSENAFVNSTGSGGTSVTGFTAAVSQGATGESIFDTAGATLQFKSLIGGTDITITDNGTALVINSTLTETFQTGTNLGTGLGIYDSKDATTHQLKFKSLAVGAGLTINDDGAGTLTLVNTVSGGGATGADTTLSNLADVATARTNLGVLSTIQGDIKYLRTDASTIPQSNNTYDIGSSVSKYNDVYAETFHGTAVLADQLTISASSGQVLTHNGSEWVAGAGSSVLSSASDMSNVAPADGQHLVWDTGTSLWTPGSAGTGGGGYQDSDARASISVAGDLSYNSSTGVITFSQNDAWSNITGTPTTLAGYGITDGGGSYANSNVDGHLNTGTATADQALVWTGTDYDWVTSTDLNTTYTAGSGLTLTGTEFSLTAAHFDGAYASLSGKPTIPTLSSQLTNDAGYITEAQDNQTLSLSGTTVSISGGNNVDLSALTLDDFADVAISSVSDGQFLTYDNGAGDWTNSTVSIFSGVFADLTSKPTTLAGYGITDGGGGGSYANSDVDSHLNQSNPTSGHVLSWNGADYAWVSNGSVGAHFTTADARNSISSGVGLSYNSGTGSLVLNASVNDLLDVSGTPSSGQVLKWTGSAWAPANDTVLTSSDQLAQGSTNLYYSNTKARDAISVSGDLSYNASTGEISFTQNDTWGNITGTPTTLSGYGITNALTTSQLYENSDVDSHLNSGSASSSEILSWNGSDYAWIANSGTPAWSAVTGKPTTIAGFGITDAITATSSTVFTNKTGAISQWTNDSGFITSVPAQTFSSLTSKPTTLAGYGITDATDTNTTYTAGSGLTLSGGAFINAAPDQTVALTGAGATSISGTYPNFTITSTDTDTDTNTTYTAGSGLTLTGTVLSLTDAHFSGVYTDLTSKPTIPSALTDLSISDGTTGQVLTTNGAGAFTFTTVSGGGGSASDKIEEGNSSVEVIDGGANGHVMFNTNGTDRWQVTNSGHILPEATETYDIGSASKKVRHLYLSDNSLYIGSDTLKTNSSNLLFNDEDIQDYANLKNKPILVSGGTGLQVIDGVVSLNSTLSQLTDVHTATPTDGQVLKWDNGNSRWAPGTDLTSGSSAMNDLSDVDTSGISTGQYLKWDGSNFVASTVTAGASSIDALTDVDTTTSAPSNGDVLTWSGTDSEWAPAAPSGGGSGATIEMFKLNYATNGNLDTVTNTTSGVSATITSATGGTVDITFGSTNYPPANMLCYGYAYASNKYVVKPVSGDMSTKEVTGGGSTGSPIAFGSMSSVKLTLKLREADTGAGRSFGTVTHAWIMFTTV